MTPANPQWRPLAAQLAETLQTSGAARTQQVTAAIAATPRHQFIPSYYQGSTHTVTDPATPTPELLGLAYTNRGIMTHRPTDAAGTHSSASQPSIVARMLEAAELAPGQRVLEIGAGTGYNAALIHHITGAPVTTVEISPVVAEEARTSLATADIQGVTVLTGDGLHGVPGGPYDRIIVTCGIGGIATAWLDQLAPEGTILAPLALGGLHPLTKVTAADGTPRAQLLASADFMAATGALYDRAHPSPSVTATALTPPDPTTRRTVSAPLDPHDSYIDLWVYLAIHDSRTTCAGGPYAGCVLVEPGNPASVVYIRPDGTVLSSPEGQRLIDHAGQHVEDWTSLGRPVLHTWTSPLTPADHLLHVPTHWLGSR